MLDTITTGHALRRSRELAGLSERSAARSLGVSRSTLRQWENDDEQPDADRIALAATVYGHDTVDIWATRTPLVSPEEPGVLIVGTERIVVRDPADQSAPAAPVDNRDVLTRYLAAVRRQRGVGEADPVELRSVDLASLSMVLDLDDDALQTLLVDLLDLTPAGAQWAVRSMLVGGLLALATTGMMGSTWMAPTASAAPIERPPAATATVAPSADSETQISASATSIERELSPEVHAAPATEVSDRAVSVERNSPFSVGEALPRAASTPNRTLPVFSVDASNAAVIVQPPVFSLRTSALPDLGTPLFAPIAPQRPAPGAIGPAPPALPPTTLPPTSS